MDNIIICAILGFFMGWLISKYTDFRFKKYAVDGHKETNDYMSKTYGDNWNKLGTSIYEKQKPIN